MKKHNIQAVHKPVRTIASALFTKKKDRIHEYDKAGVVYYHKCKECEADYVGETHRCWKERLNEHRLINRKEAKRLHSLKVDPPPTSSFINPRSDSEKEHKTQRQGDPQLC